MKSIMKEYSGFILIASLFMILGILRLNDLSLYTDCTRYLIWGNSIARGEGLVDNTQPVPEYYAYNAPLFSFVLAPVLLIFPASLAAAKVWTLLLGTLALLLFYHWLRNHFGRTTSFAATLFLALNPLMLIISTEVLSETTFLCAVFGVLILIERMEQNEPSRREFILLVVILSLIMLLREVGAALLIAAIVFLFFRKRIPAAFAMTLSALLVFAFWNYYNLGIAGTENSPQRHNLVFLLQHFVTPPETALFNELTHRFVINFKSYSHGLGGMLLYLFPNNLMGDPSRAFQLLIPLITAIRTIVAFLFIPAILAGIVYDIKHSKIAFLCFLFLCIYMFIILLYPVKDGRFLFPLLPFALYYVAVSFTEASNYLKYSSIIRRSVAYTIFIVLIFPNIMYVLEIVRTNLSYRQNPAMFSTRQTESSLQGGYFYTSWKILGEWIDRQIPAGSIVASPDKEIAPFAAKHKFLELNRAVTLPTFEALLRDNTVEYLLAPTVYDSLVEYQSMIDESKRFRFVRIHRLNRTNIYRIESRLEEQIHDSRKSQPSLDINNPSDAFRKGRIAVLQEKYPEAISIFSQLHNGSPYRTDILFQLLIAQTFALDSLGAAKNLQALYVSPNSVSYTAPAQAYMYAMNVRLHAQFINDPVVRAEQLYEVGRLYWKLGYPLQAYHMMQQAVKIDADYFAGYLWAWHYGMQTGDTIHVRQYLDRLIFIDRDNPIVKSFKKMSVSQDSLRRTGDHQKRSMLHLALSHEYHAIALPDEALDEAQHAVGENPNNAEGWQYLASLFEERNSTLAVRRAFQKASEIETHQALNPSKPQSNSH